MIKYSTINPSKLLAFAVYRPKSPESEVGIWQIQYDSLAEIGLTTMRLENITRTYSYSDTTSVHPVINMLNQSIQKITIDTNISKILIAGTDSLNFNGKFSEFVFFDSPVGRLDIYKLHTYLAIKYGVSMKEMDYVLSDSTIIWNYKKNLSYANDIAAIGKDSVLGIDQKQSSGNGGESILKIGAQTIVVSNRQNQFNIKDGDFLIWGANDSEINSLNEDSVSSWERGISKCKWRLQRSGSAFTMPTQIIIDGSKIAEDSIVQLLVNRDSIADFTYSNTVVYNPDSIDTVNNLYYFNNIYWDSDRNGVDFFTLKVIKPAVKIKLAENQAEGNGDSNGSNSDSNNLSSSFSSSDIKTCSIYPNPTTGSFTINLSMLSTTDFSIDIFNINGKQISHFTCGGSLNYSIKSLLRDPGYYNIQVGTKESSQTFKLIVE
jgi:hypothetical protein